LDDLPKNIEAQAHKQLLQRLEKDISSPVIIYTDGSQGLDTAKKIINSAAVARVTTEERLVQGLFWNLGAKIEVADVETFAITQAIRLIHQLHQ
jgi:hypothetical protein